MRENMRSHSEVSAGTSNAMAAKRSTSKYFNVKSTFSFDPPSGRTERLTDYKGYCFLSVCCVYPTTMIRPALICPALLAAARAHITCSLPRL